MPPRRRPGGPSGRPRSSSGTSSKGKKSGKGSKGSKKGSKKKSSGGSSALPLAIGGGVLALLLIAGGAWWFLASGGDDTDAVAENSSSSDSGSDSSEPTTSSEEGSDASTSSTEATSTTADASSDSKVDLSWLPPNAQVVVDVDVKQLRNAPILAEVWKNAKNQLQAQAGSQDVPSLDEMLSVTAGVEIDLSNLTDALPDPDFTVVIRSEQDIAAFTKSDGVAYSGSDLPSELSGFEVYVDKRKSSVPLSELNEIVVVVDTNTIVLGNLTGLKKAAATSDGIDPSRFPYLNQRHGVSLAVDWELVRTGLAQAQAQNEMPEPSAAAAEFLALMDTWGQGALLTVDLNEGVELFAGLEGANSTETESVATQMKIWLDNSKAQYDAVRESIPVGMVSVADDAVDSIGFRQERQEVGYTASFSPDLIASVQEQVAPMLPLLMMQPGVMQAMQTGDVTSLLSSVGGPEPGGNAPAAEVLQGEPSPAASVEGLPEGTQLLMLTNWTPPSVTDEEMLPAPASDELLADDEPPLGGPLGNSFQNQNSSNNSASSANGSGRSMPNNNRNQSSLSGANRSMPNNNQNQSSLSGANRSMPDMSQNQSSLSGANRSMPDMSQNQSSLSGANRSMPDMSQNQSSLSGANRSMPDTSQNQSSLSGANRSMPNSNSGNASNPNSNNSGFPTQTGANAAGNNAAANGSPFSFPTLSGGTDNASAAGNSAPSGNPFATMTPSNSAASRPTGPSVLGIHLLIQGEPSSQIVQYRRVVLTNAATNEGQKLKQRVTESRPYVQEETWFPTRAARLESGESVMQVPLEFEPPAKKIQGIATFDGTLQIRVAEEVQVIDVDTSNPDPANIAQLQQLGVGIFAGTGDRADMIDILPLSDDVEILRIESLPGAPGPGAFGGAQGGGAFAPPNAAPFGAPGMGPPNASAGNVQRPDRWFSRSYSASLTQPGIIRVHVGRGLSEQNITFSFQRVAVPEVPAGTRVAVSPWTEFSEGELPTGFNAGFARAYWLPRAPSDRQNSMMLELDLTGPRAGSIFSVGNYDLTESVTGDDSRMILKRNQPGFPNRPIGYDVLDAAWRGRAVPPDTVRVQVPLLATSDSLSTIQQLTGTVTLRPIDEREVLEVPSLSAYVGKRIAHPTLTEDKIVLDLKEADGTATITVPSRFTDFIVAIDPLAPNGAVNANIRTEHETGVKEDQYIFHLGENSLSDVGARIILLRGAQAPEVLNFDVRNLSVQPAP